MMLVEPAERADGHVERAILFIESARRFDLRHFGLGRNADLDAALDELLFLPRRLFEVDPGRFVRNALMHRVDDASFAAGTVSTKHGRG